MKVKFKTDFSPYKAGDTVEVTVEGLFALLPDETKLTSEQAYDLFEFSKEELLGGVINLLLCRLSKMQIAQHLDQANCVILLAYTRCIKNLEVRNELADFAAFGFSLKTADAIMKEHFLR